MKTVLIIIATLLIAGIIASTVFAVAWKLATWLIIALLAVVVFYIGKYKLTKKKARNRRPF